MQAVLIDTSTWIRFFRGDPATRLLPRLLRADMAHIHRWTIGELLLGGGIPNEHLEAVAELPLIGDVADEGTMRFLREHRLQRSGIGWVDLRLLASAHARAVALWTFDDALHQAATNVRLPRLRPESW